MWNNDIGGETYTWHTRNNDEVILFGGTGKTATTIKPLQLLIEPITNYDQGINSEIKVNGEVIGKLCNVLYGVEGNGVVIGQHLTEHCTSRRSTQSKMKIKNDEQLNDEQLTVEKATDEEITFGFKPTKRTDHRYRK